MAKFVNTKNLKEKVLEVIDVKVVLYLLKQIQFVNWHHLRSVWHANVSCRDSVQLSFEPSHESIG